MVLVTGGTGLVGAHLLLHLAHAGTPVRAIYRDPKSLEGVRNLFSNLHPDGGLLFQKIEWVIAELTDLEALESAFKGVTRVYHCAALISFDPSDFRILRKINTEGTANIVNLGLSNKIEKLCYLSSIATIGKPAGGKAATEEDFGQDRHTNVYALSKYGAEMEVWRGTQEGLPAVIVNPGIILGPGFWNRGSGVIFGMAARGRHYAPPGATGFVSVTDVVQIMVRLMESGIANERFIAVAQNMCYREILDMIAGEMGLQKTFKTLPHWFMQLLWRLDWLACKLIGKKRRLSRNSVASMRRPTHYDNSKIIDMLDFRFQPVEKTISHCCRHFIKEHPGLVVG